MDAGSRFRSLPPDTPQEQIQEHLEAVHRSDGLPAVLDGLFEFELAAGYITREKLEEVERLSFPDPETGVTFRIQVNYARSRYRPLSGSGDPAGAAGTAGVNEAAAKGAAAERPDAARPDAARARTQAERVCLLCKDNVGRPGRESLRVYEFPLDDVGRRFFVQLTPFPLFPRHFVLITSEHRAQDIDRRTVPDMLAFLRQAPRYTVCSNSDVEWAGSSILDHSHFQVFDALKLPVMEAAADPRLVARVSGCALEGLRYPLSGIRLSAPEETPLREIGSALIERWKAEDPGRNTVNLVLCRFPERARAYQLIVLLRNPDFRTPPSLRRFKSEGVGVIEASGEAILPVPEGEEAAELWRTIREDGLRIVTGIIRGNSPALPEERMRALLEATRRAAGGRAAPSGKTAVGNAAEGKAADGKAADGKAADGKAADGR
jgi:UDPglucose--hexose-1-phosphate uridylyltransferase